MLKKETRELGRKIEAELEAVTDYESAANCIATISEEIFKYAVNKVGATGFQADWAVMTLFKNLKGLSNGFQVLDYNKLLYPQYKEDFYISFNSLVEQNKSWLSQEAKRLLEKDNGYTSPSVIEHWRYLANLS